MHVFYPLSLSTTSLPLIITFYPFLLLSIPNLSVSVDRFYSHRPSRQYMYRLSMNVKSATMFSLMKGRAEERIAIPRV
jgi:hypothetical protein